MCIQEIRKALGDEADQPRYIETVPRRGYRFIAPVAAFAAPVSSSKFQVQSSSPHPSPNTQPPAPTLVGRDAELAQLHDWLEKAWQGQRQIVFATGEPGIGKTSLVEAFLAQIASDPAIWIARGQCIEHYSASEAYLPILEGIERLCLEPDHERLVPLLRQYAPLWLVQLPAVLSPAERVALQKETQGATPERRLRELATLVEALTQDNAGRASPLLALFLEDLQWSDYSTLDALTTLARRGSMARLLVIGTYRPAEVLLNGHPLRHVVQELRAHRQGAELTLEGLRTADIEAYLAAHFPQGVFPTRLAQVLHQRSGGNPLFLINLIEDLISQGLLVQEDNIWALRGGFATLTSRIPESSRHVLEKQSARLSMQEQHLLTAASIAGAEFSAAVVAAALDTAVSEVETHCEALVRQQRFLRRAGLSEWPDGTVAARYRFRHALYQQLWHERVTPSQELLWHKRIGECLENAYGLRVREVSTELAMHFEQARDYQRAVRFLQLAGEKATGQCAYREALELFSRALELLHTVPDSPERARQELVLRASLSEPLVALYGFAALEVERSYVQARDLCVQTGDTRHLFPVLQGLASLYSARAEFPKARALEEQLLHEAERAGTPELLFRAHRAIGVTLMALGEFATARSHLEQSLALQSMRQQPAGKLLDSYAWIGGVVYEALVLGILGYPDQARQRSTEALTWARQSRQPFSRSATCIQAGLLSICLQEARLTQQLAEEGLGIAREENLAQLVALGTFYQGWVLAAQGQTQDGIAQMRQGLTALPGHQSHLVSVLFSGAAGRGLWKRGRHR